ncbi:MAG: RnfABCDGE type electron transport complex subunit D [Myxococcota bacterium]
MTSFAKTLEIQTSPHITQGVSVEEIMRSVVLALLPASLFAIYAFGWAGLITLAAGTGSCLLAEYVLCRWSNQSSTLGDWSVAITGLLYGLTLPPGLPVWMTIAGGFIAVGLGKFLFGGLGHNPFNPALVGRAVLQAAFPVAMTTWHQAFHPDRFASVTSSVLAIPFTQPVYDGLSGATPLSAWKFDQELAATNELVFGLTSGSTGETSSVLILLGGLYLIARNMMNWRIPAAILGTVFVFSGLLYWFDPAAYPPPWFMLFSGGLMLGAMFMATDMVGSPMTNRGTVLHGVLIGALTVVIRIWGGMPEGVMYAILLANAFVPQIDSLIQPRVYGATKASA